VQTPDPLVLRAWTALLVAHRRCTGLLDAELQRSCGLGLDDYDVLHQLRHAGRPLRMTELAGRVLISRPSTTRVVDRLVARGWLRRTGDPDDRRVVLVELTPEGRRTHGRAARRHLDGIARLVGGPLAGHDLAATTAALEALGGPWPGPGPWSAPVGPATTGPATTT